MFPLFHLAVPLAISEIPYIRRRFRINRFVLLVGAMIPDIIDKLLLFIELGSGRFISHTLLFLFSSSLILLLATHIVQYWNASNENKITYIIPASYFIGVLIHILLDLPEIPLLYPFIPYEFVYVEEPINYWFKVLLTNPVVLITEITGIFFILSVIVKNKLYHLKDMWHYLILTQ